MPIYNPASAAASEDIHTQYFTDLGLLTGLSEIIKVTGGTTFPTPDAVRGTAATITLNLAKYGAAGATSWIAYNFSAVTKLLTICYTKPTQNTHIFHSTLDADVTKGYLGDNGYFTTINQNSSTVQYDITGGGLSSLSSDSTIFSPDATGDDWTPCIGIASYMQYTGAGDADQRIFLQFGSTSEWFPVSHTTDETHEEFKSMGLGCEGNNQRFMTPFYVYGA